MSAQNKRSLSAPTVRAFTLVEMLAVMGVVTILISLSVPALNGLAVGTGRKGAISILMNGFEQARVTALERSTNVYVGIADKEFPDNEFPNSKRAYSAFILFRDKVEGDNVPANANYVMLSKWVKLPEGISIRSEAVSLVAKNKNGDVWDDDQKIRLGKADGLPGLSDSATEAKIPVVKFSSTGAIASPFDAAALKLYLYDGYFYNNQDNFTRSSGQTGANPRFVTLSFSRFTGRPAVEDTQVPAQ